MEKGQEMEKKMEKTGVEWKEKVVKQLHKSQKNVEVFSPLCWNCLLTSHST